MRKWIAIGALVCLGATVRAADSAVFASVEERWFPEGWTEPEVAVSSTGSTSFKPSTPSGFRRQDIGAVLVVNNASCHRTVIPPVLITRGEDLNLHFRDGQDVPVKLSKWVKVDDTQYRVLKHKDGFYCLESQFPKGAWRFKKQEPAPDGR
ncbi:MAG: hypothetical protein A3K19_01870 [Lentisphaerae bacterium RIFOXYB12_FULL_65_16]|nr:MAG: hypothetical protein A3K18_29525 [Lentisphaerae bacterium RIFOXYA12_64_32]OGV92625.1 MAG: hypothetical protein A3K19_01870 [Lentisphaerae bacterium RIFOXYB12_FULL_65_16]